MSHDHPSCSVPADIDRHSDTELHGLLAEHIALLAVNHHSDDAGVAELAVHSPTLLIGGGDFLLFLDSKVLTEESDAVFSPLDFPEVLGLTGLDANPMNAFVVGRTEFFEQISGETQSERQGFFFHKSISLRNKITVNCKGGGGWI